MNANAKKGFESFNLALVDDPLIKKAMAGVMDKIDEAEQDPGRPAFHFRPPAQWMNDPNGTLYHNGYYHVFYQHNPFGETHGNMHWGHARSRDLVNWEHLPIALAPSPEKKESQIFSGCVWIDGDGKPVILYSSVGAYPRQQWAAFPEDEEWIRWKKYEGNPVVTTKANDSLTFNLHMQDPYVFTVGQRTFMVLCGGIEEQRVVTLHEAVDASLLSWEYRGILYRVTDNSGGYQGYPECPIFFELDHKYVLLHLGPMMYRVGTFNMDEYTFAPELSARMDLGSSFHATNILEDEKGKVLFSWIPNSGEYFNQKKGWNGVLALPRRLSLDSELRLLQKPAEELSALRGKAYQASAIPLKPKVNVSVATGTNMLEVIAEFDRHIDAKIGIRFKCAQRKHADFVIAYNGYRFEFTGKAESARFCNASKKLKIHAFLDKSVIEIFINDGLECATFSFMPFLHEVTVEAFTELADAEVTALNVWELKSIW
ncbi:glycoside hydrolase family 32 protein [Paenibacillus koleovorans]|uniref:glycoside hydrolase family 32 protein n=1 Tax=Paenibacillus koleovorans TaxID=121608 RepID=UPI000FD9AC83|nr:glycoside hydrolase family 32 protein [Paenibacillus koleovorans]